MLSESEMEEILHGNFRKSQQQITQKGNEKLVSNREKKIKISNSLVKIEFNKLPIFFSKLNQFAEFLLLR